MRANTLTAAHLLRYLLAEAGHEEPGLQLAPTWPVFQRFLGIAADDADVASFQVRWAGGGGDTPTLVVSCARQLTDAAGGWGPLTRVAALEFMFEQVPGEVEEEERWSADFPTLEAFFVAVEATPVWQLVHDWPAAQGNVVFDELDAAAVEADTGEGVG
jgi:hypothetical protein